jgi:uncharacterized protein (TIGR03084 family)
MPAIEDLCDDLAAEQSTLDSVLGHLDEDAWRTSTPAQGWDVLDTVSHLCFFEEAAVLSLTDPGAFEEQKRAVLAALAADSNNRPDVALGRQAGDPADVVARWRDARVAYDKAVREVAARGERVQWYGPAMSPASFTTARIQEAWAHGVDIREALHLPLEATDRLRHVCHLGYSARSYSFAVHGVEDPGDPVRLEVAAPDGSTWSWGPEGAENRITGPALDMALVFTQRRHRSRTAMKVDGPVAERWISIAQSFAGPPTVTAPGR